MGPSPFVSSLNWLAMSSLQVFCQGLLAQPIETKCSFGRVPPLTTGSASMTAGLGSRQRIKAARSTALKIEHSEEAGQT